MTAEEPAFRVGRSEMRAWSTEALKRKLTLDDEIELEYEMKRTFKKLRREFPDERWD